MPRRVIDKRIPRARKFRRDVTVAERKLWSYLKQLSFSNSHFRRQATIGPYFADFACHALRLVVEVDGGQHAENVSDAVRTRYLEALGNRVLRFWNNDVLNNVEGVAAIISAAIVEAFSPPPTPPRRRRGEGSKH